MGNVHRLDAEQRSKKPRKGLFNEQTVVQPFSMLKHGNYRKLSGHAKALMLQMQLKWYPDKPIAFSSRDAAEALDCALSTAAKALNELMERGFIVCVNESRFNSRHTSRAREYRLTWMPFRRAKPTNEWL